MPSKRKTAPPPPPVVEPTMVGRDLYLRRLSAGGTSTVTHHRVWDTEKFFNSELKAAQAEGLEVILSSKAEYEKERAK